MPRAKAAEPAVAAVTWPQVLSWRTRRQHLLERAPARRLVGVVSDLVGVHAQLTASAELQCWARLERLEAGVVAAELWQQRRLVRTWAMRGTLHLLAAQDLPVVVGAQRALKPRYSAASWERYHGITAEEVDAALEVIPEVLDGDPLTRQQLADAVAARAGRPSLREALQQSWGAVLKIAARRGELCFAEPEGQNVRFTRPDRWLGGLDELDGQTARTEVTRRYLAAYGPASREHYARWAGTPSAAEAGRWIDALGDEAATVDVEGAPLRMLAADVEELSSWKPVSSVHLLPAFDHYVVAAPRDADAVLDPAQRKRVYRPQGWISPVVLVGGRVAGVWSSELAKGALEVSVEPFQPLSRTERRALQAEVDRLAEFQGAAPKLTLAPPA